MTEPTMQKPTSDRAGARAIRRRSRTTDLLGGTMLRNGRLIASGLAAAALLVAACASRPESVAGDAPRGSGELQASAAAVAAGAAAPVTLTGATLLVEGDAPRLLLSGTGPLSPTVYPRVDGTAIVVDLPNAVVSPGLEPPRGNGGLLTQVAMRSFTELGKPHVQFELSGRVPLESRMGTEGGTAMSVTISARQPEVAPAAPAADDTRVAALVPDTAPVRAETLPAVTSASAPAPAPAAQTAASSDGRIGLVHHAASGRAATRLAALSAKRVAGGAAIRLSGDGAWAYDAFALADPPRYVIDLLGVRNAGKKRQVEVGAGGVARVR